MRILTAQTFQADCDRLAATDSVLRSIITDYGYPPFWSRPNSYESLVQIILEQQVSLASAKSSYTRLVAAAGEVTPEQILTLTDEQFRDAYVSRQKARYIRELAESIQTDRLNLNNLEKYNDETVKNILIKHNGIGQWTIDVYVIEVLHRTDVFPTGDVAAMRALAHLKANGRKISKEEALELVEPWRPNRTVATMLLWHQYLASRGRSDDMLAST